MNIGFAGAHRVGKTTLAKSLAAKMGFTFYETSIGKDASLWKNNHISVGEHFCFAERVLLQLQVLEYLKPIVTRKDKAIYDRTYIDLVGYLYANVDTSTSNLSNEGIERLVLGCVYEQSRNLDLTIFVPPAIEIQGDSDKKGKTFLSVPYITAVSNNILASCITYLDPTRFLQIPPHIKDNDERIKWIVKEIKKL